MESPIYKKNALIIGILLGLIFALCLLLVLFLPGLQKTGRLTALVYQDGALIHNIDLSRVTEEYELNITNSEGHYNLLRVRPGAIGITDADCPDKLCVHMGYRDSTLLPITCLPNKLVIRIVSDAALSGQTVPLDGITY